jgi:hypothetical protein
MGIIKFSSISHWQKAENMATLKVVRGAVRRLDNWEKWCIVGNCDKSVDENHLSRFLLQRIKLYNSSKQRRGLDPALLTKEVGRDSWREDLQLNTTEEVERVPYTMVEWVAHGPYTPVERRANNNSWWIWEWES